MGTSRLVPPPRRQWWPAPRDRRRKAVTGSVGVRIRSKRAIIRAMAFAQALRVVIASVAASSGRRLPRKALNRRLTGSPFSATEPAHACQVGLQRDDRLESGADRDVGRRAPSRPRKHRLRKLLDGGVDRRAHRRLDRLVAPSRPVSALRPGFGAARGAAIQSTSPAGSDKRSRGSGPAMTDSISAASATLRVIGPTCSIDSQPEDAGQGFVAAAGPKRHAAHRRLDADKSRKAKRECGSSRRRRCRSRAGKRPPRPPPPSRRSIRRVRGRDPRDCGASGTADYCHARQSRIRRRCSCQ